jgi:hypothetical protein
MANEETGADEATAWWAVDAFTDTELPSISIDEPLEWPDSLPWEEYSASAPADEPPPVAAVEPVDLVFPTDAGAELPPPPPDSDLEWQPGGYDADATVTAPPLAGLGGGGDNASPASGESGASALPESIWSFDSGPVRSDEATGFTALAAPLVCADTDGKGRGKWPRQLDIRRGNVAIVALISAVSLVLLGMFLSVRSRNDLPTDATASPHRTDQIATANTRNTIPTTTSVVTTTTVPAPVINIADLVPAGEAGGTGTGAAGGTAVATTAPARSNVAPAGGGSSTATTQPAPQSTATTAAPDPPVSETTTPTTAAPPVDSTPDTTRPRTSTSITFPDLPDITVPGGGDGPTLPNLPNFPGIPR